MTSPQERAVVDAVNARIKAFEKASVDAMLAMKKRLEADHERRKPSVTVNPTVESKAPDVHVAAAVVDTTEIAKALRDLGDLIASTPVPVVQSPDHPVEVIVNPTPLLLNLSDLQPLLAGLDNAICRLTDRLDAMDARDDAAFEVMTAVAATNQALTAAINRKRDKRSFRLTEDGIQEL